MSQSINGFCYRNLNLTNLFEYLMTICGKTENMERFFLKAFDMLIVISLGYKAEYL